ncbi:MAG: hypothetical protein K6G75_07950 [Lachnospiraceae bacterium]|nr:hypothetical protein [Lachnospiraceae bacterium]
MRPLIKADVICLHTKDGKVEPIRIRITDEDGQSQAFTIKEFNDISHQGARTMPDGYVVSDNTLNFYCKILVFGREKKIRLFSNPPYLEWMISYF